uniref:Dynein heavy chain axonemal n=1 Tax=Hirondellea gigas TaxID=1518452 RepID=A0A6A7GE25_9CRUS
MHDWLMNGPPKAYWLPGFFFPQGFMTGFLQNHARKYQIAIDSLGIRFKVLHVFDLDDITEPPDDGLYVYGLFLDGARWDTNSHTIENSRLGELYSRIPMIHFIPAENYTPNPKDYSAPCYKTSVRAGILSTTGQSTNFILPIELPTSINPSYWVLKGAAILCQLND